MATGWERWRWHMREWRPCGGYQKVIPFFLWTVGLPFGPFVLPRAYKNALRSSSNPAGREFHAVFGNTASAEATLWHLRVSLWPFSLALSVCVPPQPFVMLCFCTMPCRQRGSKSKHKRKPGLRSCRRTPAAIARRREGGRLKLQRKMCTVLAGLFVRCIFLGRPARPYIGVLVTKEEALSVLRRAITDVSQRVGRDLHRGGSRVPDGTEGQWPTIVSDPC